MMNTGKKWALIFWTEDKKVLIEAMGSIPLRSRSEGSVAMIKFSGGRRYLGKVVEMSGEFLPKFYRKRSMINT